MKSFFATHRLILLLSLITLSLFGVWGEKIPVNNQTGWDGKHYANLTTHFDSLASSFQIDSYQYQRILTPAVIHYSAKLFSYPLSTQNIVSVFAWYNLLLIICTALLFFKTAQFLNINTQAELIGFCALFANVMVLKNTPYYPILTDTTAFFVGMCLTYYYITNNSIGLLITTAITIVCYPLMFVVSLPLALNLRGNQLSTFFTKYFLYRVLSVGIIALVLLGIYQILWVPNTLLPRYTMELNNKFLPLSIMVLICYLWRSFNPFTKHQDFVLNSNIKPAIFTFIGLASLWVLITILIGKISIPEEVFTPMVFIYNILQQSIDNPCISFIAHVTYLGPAIILVFLLYQSFSKTVASFGDSAIFYFLLGALFAIGSESRQFVHLYPFVVCMLMITLSKQIISNKQAFIFIGISLVSSKCWFPINTPTSFTDYDYTTFPNQRYFMNHGPFMSDMSYWINLGIVLVIATLLYFIFGRLGIKKADI